MLKKVVTNGKMPSATEKAVNNHTFGPARIGPILKARADELKLKPKMLAPLVNRDWRTIYPTYKRKYLRVPEMETWSKALNMDLFALYQPKVDASPKEAEALRKELEEVKKERDALLVEVGQLNNKVTRLEGQKDLLEEQVDQYMRRKG